MSLCHLGHTYGWFVFGRAFPKCAFSLHVADERRRTFGHSEVWKARRNQEYLEAPQTFWKLGMWELRRLLSNSSVSLGRCFARLGPICSAHCATRSAGPSSLPANIHLNWFKHFITDFPHLYNIQMEIKTQIQILNLLQQLVCNLSEKPINVVAAFRRSLEKIHSVPAVASSLT